MVGTPSICCRSSGATTIVTSSATPACFSRSLVSSACVSSCFRVTYDQRTRGYGGPLGAHGNGKLDGADPTSNSIASRG